ncbi:MAG: hypothetical protein A2Y95_12965 [Deltaproteobacteria bacterium RBG_13_65_10]|nr:MAG: hypothetical protein A2Y95_12965 [Deltaproteobacteria bacterium RBG_13_65_10]
MKAASSSGPAPAAPLGGPAERACLATLILAGALFRAAYFRALLHWPYHREALIVGDGRVYHDAALRILAGSPWGVPVSWQDPLYPTFLALVMKLTGSDLSGPLLVQHGLGLAAAVLAWVIGRRMAGPVAGLVAAGFVALSPVAVYYEGLLEKSAPGVFFFALAAWLLASGIATGSARRAAGAGAALALTALLRGNTLLVLPAAALAVAVARPAPRRGPVVLALAAGVALVFVPAIVRNHAIRGTWSLTAGQGGANFWDGNNPGNKTGTFWVPRFLRADPQFEEADWRVEAQRRTGGSLTSAEVSRFWFREGLRFWTESPAAAIRNTVRKALLFVSARELPDTQAFPFFRDHFAPLRLPLPGMGPIAALSLVGAAISLGVWRARAAELALFAGYAASVVLFFVLGRYRVITLALFAAFAGVAVAAMVEFARRRERTRFAVLVAALALALVPVWRARGPEQHVFPYLNIALTLHREGRDAEAERFVLEGLSVNPRDVPSLQLRGELALARGDTALAEQWLLRAFRLDPSLRPLQLDLVHLREKQGRPEEALALVEILLREDPFDSSVRAEWTRLRAAVGR